MAADDLLRLGRGMVGEVRDRIARSRDPVAFARSKGVTIGERCVIALADLSDHGTLLRVLNEHEVSSVFHGFRVAPNTSLKVLAPAPNSGVFDMA